jgi:D-glycero-alpha-D-manno-heptose-7-phosphate kinase
MLISRTPVRISFFGGGTDYPHWYEDNFGAVIATTINKYSYITLRYLPRFFEYKYRLRYFQTEQLNSIQDIQHPSIRECAKFLGVKDGFEIVHNGDLPASSGLGSSSTFTVGMLNAFHALNNNMPTKRELALQAIDIEQNKIKEIVGSQDQISAAFGGLNYIEFGGDEVFKVNPMTIGKQKIEALQESLLLCFTGFARSASTIAKYQVERCAENKSMLQEILDITLEAKELLNSSNFEIEKFGQLLDRSWQIKRNLSSVISNTQIEEIYIKARENGAIGGKLLGAGGGGFMLFCAPKENHEQIKKSLPNNLFVPFKFESTGSQIIYYSND